MEELSMEQSDKKFQVQKTSLDIESMSELAQMNIDPQEQKKLEEQIGQVLKLANTLLALEIDPVWIENNKFERTANTRQDIRADFDQAHCRQIIVPKMVEKNN